MLDALALYFFVYLFLWACCHFHFYGRSCVTKINELTRNIDLRLKL